ncbi:Fe-S cluster assembly protein SufD [Rhodoblastus sphagnicola]|uniref:Fe-S cluster assembly protein SufD n=1 Tax=Rhodoblastus sphagnicola TaxID=333368 RepID=A0A2S6N9Y9_9HYPH|nr:Fe-S cluster assembly protein SufD [Rhodoblastus sphagnicola]MBB4198786.1 Fe-S cluster assembly protein SufD [Rhodoblastus sphagnicola]PPQ31419.1 Fe-S cluster assembly protein SufD [Rhodoblastus sphagnicola]
MTGSLSDTLLATMEQRRGAIAPWLGELQGQAQELFRREGLPSRRIEAWRYSDLARALREDRVADATPVSAPELPGAALAAFVNGALDDKASSYGKVGAVNLRTALGEKNSPLASIIGKVYPQAGHPIVNLNTALLEEGLALRVPAGKKLDLPLHLRFLWTGAASDGRHLRLLIELEEGAEATIYETHDGAPSFATIVTEFSLAKGSRLTHIRQESLAAGARQAAVTLGEIAEQATYHAFYFTQGAHFARHEALIKLAGEGAHAELDGATMVADSRHADNTTVMEHAAPNATSNQVFRAVLAGSARGVYQGCVKVAQAAQKTDARQLSRALLLSHKAEIVTKPELEIFADDVKCSHGATAGELDANALFFLRARGIPEAQARALLIEAFFGEALDKIDNEVLRESVSLSVHNWLSTHAGEASHVE